MDHPDGVLAHLRGSGIIEEAGDPRLSGNRYTCSSWRRSARASLSDLLPMPEIMAENCQNFLKD